MTDTGNQKPLTMGELDLMINNNEINGIMSKQLPAAASMQLARLVRKCSEELKEFSEKKQEIINDCSKKDNDGNPIVQPGNRITIDPLKAKEVDKRMTEINEVPVSEDFIMPTILLEIESLPTMTPQEALAILPFIKEE